jgi:hypothetical protein
MVALPFLAAAAVAPGNPFRLSTAAAALAVLAVFLLRDPLVLLRRIRNSPGRPETVQQRMTAWRSLALCLGGMAIAGMALLLSLPALWIFVLGAAGLLAVIGSVVIAVERAQREVSSQLLSVVGLTASCLPAYLSVCGTLDGIAVVIWLMSAAHSIAAVLVVRARLETILLQRRAAATTGKRRFYRAAVAWHVGLWTTLAVLAGAGYSALALPFLLPGILHVWELIQFRRGAGLQISMHRVGWSQLVASVFFCASLVVLFRLRMLA